jgi:hypothetical protein
MVRPIVERTMIKKILLAVLVAAVLAAGTWYFVAKRHLPAPVDAGVPVYPGAKNMNADTFSARLSPRDRARLVKVVFWETADPPEKVIQFYKEKLPGKTAVAERRLHGLPAAVFRTEIDGKPKLLMVSVNEETEKTEISIGNISDASK